MPYYSLMLADEKRWHLDVASNEPPIDIWACRPAPDKAIPIVIQVPGTPVDYNQTSFAIIVVSRRMAEVLDSIASMDIQRIPALLEGRQGDWEVLNIVSKVDCIDHERSCIQYYPETHPEKPGKPRGVASLILDANRAKGHHVFRPATWEVAPIISEDVKNALDMIGVTGLEFVAVCDESKNQVTSR